MIALAALWLLQACLPPVGILPWWPQQAHQCAVGGAGTNGGCGVCLPTEAGESDLSPYLRAPGGHCQASRLAPWRIPGLPAPAGGALMGGRPHLPPEQVLVFVGPGPQADSTAPGAGGCKGGDFRRQALDDQWASRGSAQFLAGAHERWGPGAESVLSLGLKSGFCS